MSIRYVAIVTVLAYLLLASSFTTAQAPPGPEARQRLQALEQKMDRIQQLLEGRTLRKVVDPSAVPKQAELIKQARDVLATKLEAQQQAYCDWRQKTPYPGGLGGRIGLQKRIERDDARVQDLQQRQADLTARMALVKNVGDSETSARALLILLQRRGVDLEALRQAAREDAANPVALLRLYAASLRLEADELQQLIAAAEVQRERDAKLAQDITAHEFQEERLKMNLTQSRELLSAIVKRLQEISLLLPEKP